MEGQREDRMRHSQPSIEIHAVLDGTGKEKRAGSIGTSIAKGFNRQVASHVEGKVESRFVSCIAKRRVICMAFGCRGSIKGAKHDIPFCRTTQHDDWSRDQ